MTMALELTGKTFGRLLVLRREGSRAQASIWKCKCECGRETITRGPSLVSGATQSCGCYGRERASYSGKLNTTHGMTGTRTYASWFQMWQRCRNKNSKDYERWGARGIRVCDRWLDFGAFLADMGVRPAGMTLDRWPDGAGNYEPGNCRWATLRQQAQNQKSNHLIEHDGQTLCVTEWARRAGIKKVTFEQRLRRGWSIERAIAAPIGPNGPKRKTL